MKELCERLDRHSFDWDGVWPVGALLHTPGAVIRRINDASRLDTLIAGLMIATVVFGALYGIIMGLFVPGEQTLFAAAKVPLILLGTALLCAPTFYIFNAILGASFTFRQSLSLILCLTVAAGLILAAFAPIAWFFTVSTNSVLFLTLLHVAVLEEERYHTGLHHDAGAHTLTQIVDADAQGNVVGISHPAAVVDPRILHRLLLLPITGQV